ncbi:MAG: hypothetical protein ACTSUV_00345 [Candidatus Ranarchaeia archaeon]
MVLFPGDWILLIVIPYAYKGKFKVPSNYLKKYSIVLGTLLGFCYVGLPELLPILIERPRWFFSNSVVLFHFCSLGVGFFASLFLYWGIEKGHFEVGLVPFLVYYFSFFLIYVFPYTPEFNLALPVLFVQGLGILFISGVSWGVWYYLFLITHKMLITRYEKKNEKVTEEVEPYEGN